MNRKQIRNWEIRECVAVLRQLRDNCYSATMRGFSSYIKSFLIKLRIVRGNCMLLFFNQINIINKKTTRKQPSFRLKLPLLSSTGLILKSRFVTSA